MLASRVRAHPVASILVAAGGVSLVAVVVWWFAPQRLLFDQRVEEPLPAAISPTAGSTQGEDDVPVVPERETLASGRFRSLEHETSGRAVVIEVREGGRYLRLDQLATSNGPDLRVYLTDQPVSDDWFVWDDGAFVDLGPLKGNLGSSNYRIPADVDLARFETTVVWCRRFTVGFGVAPLVPAR